MLNQLIKIKIQERLNKLASSDYDNIEDWQVCEAFNKEQVEWVRRQISGTNLRKEGDDQTQRRIDDLQILLKSTDLKGTNKVDFFESVKIPVDFMELKRISCYGKTECCPEKKLTVYPVGSADVDVLLGDNLSTPDFQWGETFAELAGNKAKIYHNNKFTITRAKITYYKQPTPIEMKGVVNHLGVESTKEVACEFKDDIIELLIDGAAGILSGDIESQIQLQRNTQSQERNN